MSNEVERVYSELASVKDSISKNGSASDLVAFESIAAKSFILAAASYFEKAVCDLLVKHAENMSKSTTLVSFLDKQALNRKYHTLFNWEAANINKFLRLFGNDFFEFMGPKLAEDKIRTAAKEFLFLGQTRNELVHNNFSEYSLQITTEDIKGKFDTALPLMAFLAQSLEEFEQSRLQAPNSDD